MVLNAICRTIFVPLLTARLASTAQRSLSVDAELSPLVRRTLSLSSTSASPTDTLKRGIPPENSATAHDHLDFPEEKNLGTNNLIVLKVEYKATTNRMLRVAVNGFMESLAMVIDVMEGLDIDVLATKVKA